MTSTVRSAIWRTHDHETSIGIVNECQIGSLDSRVVPVLSMFTAAICDPLAGKSQTPINDGHIATIVAGASDARAIGTIVRMVADWLVVKPATRNNATDRNSGRSVTGSASGSITVAW